MTSIERITDANGDEEEHGEHDPSECPVCAANQPQPTDEVRPCCEHCQPDDGDTEYCDGGHPEPCWSCGGRDAARQQDGGDR